MYRQIFSGLIKSLIFAGALALAIGPQLAYSDSTVVLTTTTYAGADQTTASLAPVALPEVGAYIFDMVAESSGTADTWGLQLYLQQEGVAGGKFYTINASTFTTCNSNCTQFVVPDIYLGGRIRAQWAITSGSATITVTARQIDFN